MRITYSFLVTACLASSITTSAQNPESGWWNFSDDNVAREEFYFLDNDGGVSEIGDVPVAQCNTSIAPKVVIENFGNNILTSATLEYFVDGGSPTQYLWSGSLYPFWQDTISLPVLNVTPGTHTLTVLIIQANGTVDVNGGNDNSIEFNVIGQSEPAPYEQTFSNPDILPDGFFVNNQDKGFTWHLFNSFYFQPNNTAMQMPFYNNDVDQDVDELYMKNIDLSYSASPQLSFNLAYAFYSEYYADELQVLVSTDCGSHWDVVYDKWKNDLATAPFTDVHFIPTPSQWRKEYVSLFAYSGNSDVVVKFKAINGHGNNLYIDDINIEENTGIGDGAHGLEIIKAFPNPANENITVLLNQSLSFKTLEVINTLGQCVFSSGLGSQNQIDIPLKDFLPGTYFISLTSAERHYTSLPIVVYH